MQKEIDELRTTIAMARDTEEAAQNEITQTLRDQLQTEKRENAQNEREIKELKKSLQSSTDKATG